MSHVHVWSLTGMYQGMLGLKQALVVMGMDIFRSNKSSLHRFQYSTAKKRYKWISFQLCSEIFFIGV